MPRKSRAGYTWLHIHVSQPLHDVVARLALEDDRSMSGMARRLLIEALRTRGIEGASLGEQDDES